jgi:hypothetical protein
MTTRSPQGIMYEENGFLLSGRMIEALDWGGGYIDLKSFQKLRVLLNCQ